MVLPPRPRKSRWGARAAAVGEAREFYQGILGMTETTKPIGLAARGGCWFEDGELKVHLGIEKNLSRREGRIRPSSWTVWPRWKPP